MTRADRYLASVLAVIVTSPLLLPEARAAEAGKVPPEKTYSNAPFLHRILLRDENGDLINAPKPVDPKASGEGERAKPFSTTTTCGKCHDYQTMSHGWHFNASEKDASPGRPGEPWILTDAQTRTQLPLSYRRWPGTWHPYDVGINDYNFVKTFGRNLPGGGAFAGSKDLRFKMSGKLEIDCLICHSTNPHDTVERAKQIADAENFRYAPTAASLLGRVQGTAAKLKDTWDPSNPDAPQPPRVIYRPERFDNENNVTFQVSRRVANERCYACHTSIDVGKPGHDQQNLESRWRHDRDIHLVKGMMCVDCHRNGVDHMISRGYEGESKVRGDASLTTLTCRGCHYGTESTGGRLAAPRPAHYGLPTLHFDKIACTTCHSGPRPGDETTQVQTSMAHRLGMPRHHHTDEMAPQIQQVVFLRQPEAGVDHEGEPKIAPYKMLYPSFWGRLSAGKITPIQPQDVVAAGAGSILGQKPGPMEDPPIKPLMKEQILQVLEKLAAAKPPAKIAPSALVTGAAETPAGSPATSQAASQPAASQPATSQPSIAAQFTGEPVYITGGKAYKRAAGGKNIEAFDHPMAAAYAWSVAHDVRSAQQALGARGCTDCHSFGAPLFDGKVASLSVVAGANSIQAMHEIRGDSMGALAAFAATYPMRPILITTGYICAIILALVLITYAGRLIGAVTRRD